MHYHVVNKQPNSKMCFVCGLGNPFGLKSFFYGSENKELIALFTPRDEHQSYPGRLHGGISSAIIDETIGRAIMQFYEGELWGVTLELNLKYRKPVPLNCELKVIGRITSENSRFFEGSGEIYLPSGEVAVSATGKYMKMPLDKITDFDLLENNWYVVEDENDPKVIEI